MTHDVKATNGLVNGELVNDLLSLCNTWFLKPWFKPYAGAREECLFCGCLINSKHSENCPVVKFQEVVKKHSKFVHDDYGLTHNKLRKHGHVSKSPEKMV